MAMENLYIQGEPDGASEFLVNLPPGKNCFKILKPVERGLQTQIQMRYEFEFK